METPDWSEWFVYDESSPSGLRWKVDRVSGRYKNHVHVRAGSIAGTAAGTTGYYQVKLHQKSWLCHHVIAYMHGMVIEKGQVIDHIDGDKLNNKVHNLRVIPRSKNPRNAKKRKDNRSGVTGVTKITNGQGNYYWSARCEDGKGGFLQKRFALTIHSDEEAFRLACEWREKMIEQLNTEGAGYTERHGKEGG